MSEWLTDWAPVDCLPTSFPVCLSSASFRRWEKTLVAVSNQNMLGRGISLLPLRASWVSKLLHYSGCGRHSRILTGIQTPIRLAHVKCHVPNRSDTGRSVSWIFEFKVNLFYSMRRLKSSCHMNSRKQGFSLNDKKCKRERAWERGLANAWRSAWSKRAVELNNWEMNPSVNTLSILISFRYKSPLINWARLHFITISNV